MTTKAINSVHSLKKYSKIIKKIALIKNLDLDEVNNEAWLVLAEFPESIIVTDQLFERKLLSTATNISKSCGLGRGSKGGCVDSMTTEDGQTVEIGFAESAEDIFTEKQRVEAAIAELPDRTRQLLETLETNLNGREVMQKFGDRLGSRCLSVINRRIVSETKRACEVSPQGNLF